jgi:hypothetical protein
LNAHCTALALEAVGDGARERLGEDGRGDAAEQEQGEHEGRGDDDVALVAPEPDGQHLAGHDGDGEGASRIALRRFAVPAV